MGRETMGEIRHGLGDPPEGKELVGGHSWRTRTGQGPRGGAGWAGGPSGRSGTGHVNLKEVQYGSEDPRGGPG